jgi:hypothetical protein
MTLYFKRSLVLILIAILVLQVKSENSIPDWDISHDRLVTSYEENSIISWNVPSKLINSIKVATSSVPIVKCLNIDKTYLSFNRMHFILISCFFATSSVFLLTINIFVLRKMLILRVIVKLKKSVHLKNTKNAKITIDNIKRQENVNNILNCSKILNASTSNEPDNNVSSTFSFSKSNTQEESISKESSKSSSPAAPNLISETTKIDHEFLSSEQANERNLNDKLPSLFDKLDLETISCQCKKGCKTNHCKCMKNKKKCNSNCHTDEAQNSCENNNRQTPWK